MWMKMKQADLFDRAGVAWVISDEVMLEIKGTLYRKQPSDRARK
jgi:hypothetical protein